MKYCHCPNQEGKRIASDCEDCNVGLNWEVMNYHLDAIIEKAADTNK
jgi:hypothetical protein